MSMKISEEQVIELINNGGIKIVNNISISDLCTIINESFMEFRNFEKLGHGSYGDVFGYNDYAVKRFKNYLNEDNLSECLDAEILIELDEVKSVPKLYAVVYDEILIMERVYGYTVGDYCEDYNNEVNNPIGIDEEFIDKFKNALLDIVKAGYTPKDLHEYNVMIDSRNKEPKIVDVGLFRRHNQRYDNSDIHSLESNNGYMTANSWTGSTLRRFVNTHSDIMFKKNIEKEAKTILNGYNLMC